jgi:cytoskeletal protein CcmA (bactofilin family)
VPRAATPQPRESAPPAPRELPPPPPKKVPPLTVIAQGTAVDGRVQVAGDLRVDGRVEGPLLAAGAACEISPGGSVAVETARAASLVVHGTLHAGEVVARRVLVSAAGTLHARVLAAEGVEVEAGGTLAAVLEIGAAPTDC